MGMKWPIWERGGVWIQFSSGKDGTWVPEASSEMFCQVRPNYVHHLELRKQDGWKWACVALSAGCLKFSLKISEPTGSFLLWLINQEFSGQHSRLICLRPASACFCVCVCVYVCQCTCRVNSVDSVLSNFLWVLRLIQVARLISEPAG